jgi:hypothetical protein
MESLEGNLKPNQVHFNEIYTLQYNSGRLLTEYLSIFMFIYWK